MSFASLGVEAPRAQPAFLKQPLYPHQTAELHAMEQLETSVMQPLHVQHVPDVITMKSTCGILASPPASGKSITVLALIAKHMQLPSMAQLPIIDTRLQGLLRFEQGRAPLPTLNANLIVAPRGTINQWKEYVTRFWARDQATLIKSTMRPEDIRQVYRDAFSLVITGESGWRALRDEMERAPVKFQRIIIDEADSIKLKSPVKVHGYNIANFCWFITASVRTLCRGSHYGGVKSAWIGTLFGGCIATRQHAGASHIVVASSPEFVSASIQIPQLNESVIHVHRPDVITPYGFITCNVIAALNAEDYAAAISLMGCKSAENTDCVVSIMTQKLREDALAIEEAMASAETGAITALASRHSAIVSKINSITERIKACQICPITFASIDTMAVTPCCQQGFEYSALIRALDASRRNTGSGVCPMCRTSITPPMLTVNIGDASKRVRTIPKTKQSALTELLGRLFPTAQKHGPGLPRVLIFSSHSMYMAENACNDAHVSYEIIMGTAQRINKHINRFRDGDVNVIMLNSTHFGAGLNLECATHIVTVHSMPEEKIKQLIGRAQRVGRTCALELVHLEYTNEHEITDRARSLYP